MQQDFHHGLLDSLRRVLWSIGSRPLRLVLCGVLGAAFLAVAAISTRTAPDTYPVADTATTSIATLQAARGSLAVGSYSRFGWNHPGPLLYQILAGPYELSGRREIALKWTALALNLIWLGGLLAIVGRRAPGLAVAIAVALVPLLWREQRLLFSAWNPFVTVLALACAVAAAADLATGGAWRTRLGATWLVLPLSFCIQAHAGLVVPSAVCVLIAACGLWRRGTPDREPIWPAIRSGLLIATAVAAVLWLTPLLAERRQQPGNLASMVRFLTDESLPRDTWTRGLAAAGYMTLGPYLPAWVVLYDEVPRDLPAWLPWMFGALVTGVTIIAARADREGRAFEATFAATCAAISISVIVAARGVVGPLSDYLLLWATGIGALDVAVVIAAAMARQFEGGALGGATAFVRAGGLATAWVLAWSVIGGLRLAGKHAEQARDTTLRALSTDLQAYCDRTGINRPLLAFGGDTAWQEATGLVLQFDKVDRPIAVEDVALYLVGRSFARTGREDATFFLMPTTGVALPADAGRTEWITTRGAYRIVRLRVR
jgi:hypothetical protein